MAGNEDRGGIQELVALIKSTCIPIICICNDRSLPKMRTLSNHCFDLRFQRPRVDQIKVCSALLTVSGNVYVVYIKPTISVQPFLNSKLSGSARLSQQLTTDKKQIYWSNDFMHDCLFSHQPLHLPFLMPMSSFALFPIDRCGNRWGGDP